MTLDLWPQIFTPEWNSPMLGRARYLQSLPPQGRVDPYKFTACGVNRVLDRAQQEPTWAFSVSSFRSASKAKALFLPQHKRWETSWSVFPVCFPTKEYSGNPFLSKKTREVCNKCPQTFLSTQSIQFWEMNLFRLGSFWPFPAMVSGFAGSVKGWRRGEKETLSWGKAPVVPEQTPVGPQWTPSALRGQCCSLVPRAGSWLCAWALITGVVIVGNDPMSLSPVAGTMPLLSPSLCSLWLSPLPTIAHTCRAPWCRRQPRRRWAPGTGCSAVPLEPWWPPRKEKMGEQEGGRIEPVDLAATGNQRGANFHFQGHTASHVKKRGNYHFVHIWYFSINFSD